MEQKLRKGVWRIRINLELRELHKPPNLLVHIKKYKVGSVDHVIRMKQMKVSRNY
jgi:hypothetical protein